MQLTPIPCTDKEALELIKICRGSASDDSDPFYMAQLSLFDLQTASPITKQTIEAALDLFIENLPDGAFKEFLDPTLLQDGKMKYQDWYAPSKVDFDTSLRGWLSEYKSFVRSPIRKEIYEDFLQRLYSYLGKPHFFYIRNSMFKAPNYYCDNINAFIVTQNHGKFPVDKIAMFSFFSPD